MELKALEEYLRHPSHKKFMNFTEATISFQILLQTRGIPAKFISNVLPSSCETFLKFLQAIGGDAPASLIRKFEESKFAAGSKACETSEFLRDYEKFEQNFYSLPVDIVLYFIDDVLLGERPFSKYPPLSPLEMIRKIRSVIGWLIEIFPECPGGADWKEIFLDHDRKLPEKYLDWLSRTDQNFFLRGEGVGGEPITQSDLDSADFLWTWLETHPQRPIKLAYSMVLCGMNRDVNLEKGKVDLEIDELFKCLNDENDVETQTKKQKLMDDFKRKLEEIGA